jgi:antitoxin component YwqK of YwqJK toxin-antitoxin module
LLDSAELLLDHSGQWVQHAHYRAGQWHGTVTTFYGNGKPKEQRTYEHGVLSGISTWFYDNGNPMAQYPYVAGKKQGRAQYFYDNGVLEKNEWFEENLSVRWESFDLDGKQTGSGKTKKNP